MGNPAVLYSKSEIARVRDYITGAKTVMREPSLEPLRKDMEKNPNLIHFRRLLAEDVPLLEKIKADPRVARFSFFMFMPVLEDRLHTGMEDIEMRIINVEEFGSAARIRGNGLDLTVRPVHNLDEPAVAHFASGCGIGPKQLPSWDGYITEEFVNGRQFQEISARLGLGEAAGIGETVGRMVAQLHQAGIKLNKPVFENALGKSHLRINGDGVMMVDFSGAIRTIGYPNLSYMRAFWFLVSATGKGETIQSKAASAKELDAEIRKHKQFLSTITLESFLRSDLHIIQDALLQVTAGKNEKAAGAVWGSFVKAYEAQINTCEPEIDLALP